MGTEDRTSRPRKPEPAPTASRSAAAGAAELVDLRAAAGVVREPGGGRAAREPEARVRGCCAPLDPGHVSEADQARLLTDLEAIAHPIRLRLLTALAANPGRVCVCDLEAIVPVKQPTVSHHLRILRSAGLVDSERRGLWSHYRVRRDALRALAGRVGRSLEALAGAAPLSSEEMP